MALVVPRSRPAVPGNRLGIFVVVCVLFFAAQLTAVRVLPQRGRAREPVAEGATTETTATSTTETTTTETTPPSTESQSTETTTETAAAAGDAGAGKEV